MTTLIIPDIDQLIINLSAIKELAKLAATNKHFNKQLMVIVQQYKNLDYHYDEPKNQFFMACQMGYRECAQYLLNHYEIDIHANDGYLFWRSCSMGQLEIAKWLLTFKFDIHADDDVAFRTTCYNNHLDVAKWLVSLDGKIDIHAKNDYAFRWCVNYREAPLARWLIELGKNGYGEIPQELIDKCGILNH